MDKKKQKLAPILVAVLLVAYFVMYAAMLLWIPGFPTIPKLLLAVIPVAMIGVSIWAARERMREIDSGEEDDLNQY